VIDREQRVTGFCVFALIGLSTLVTPVLRVSDAPTLCFTSIDDSRYLEHCVI